MCLYGRVCNVEAITLWNNLTLGTEGFTCGNEGQKGVYSFPIVDIEGSGTLTSSNTSYLAPTVTINGAVCMFPDARVDLGLIFNATIIHSGTLSLPFHHFPLSLPLTRPYILLYLNVFLGDAIPQECGAYPSGPQLCPITTFNRSSIYLNWTAPSWKGSSAVTEYEVDIFDGGAWNEMYLRGEKESVNTS
jgi:hypothetical protein